jgi:SAM-dependent methyltransferase
MTVGALTDQADWDAYWEETQLPVEVRRHQSLYIDEILAVFDRWLARDESRSALEIGGAPGGYLAYLNRRFGFKISILDFSPRGCDLARRNLELLNLDGVVHEGNLFDAYDHLPKYDIVYSLGLIEHFENLTPVVRAHARYLKPGGILIIGCPNFRGVNNLIARRLSPSILRDVELRAMDFGEWTFETELGVERLFAGYVGGFEPSMFWRCESSRVSDRLLWRTLTLLGKVTNARPFSPLRKINSSRWSGYMIGVYRAVI